MQELVLGIDICDDYSQISYYNPQIFDVENIGLGGLLHDPHGDL